MRGAFISLIAGLLMVASPISAAPQNAAPPEALVDTPLTDSQAEAQARQLMLELRCVQCQGQSIADSDAPIAVAMRQEVRKRVAAGQTNSEIRDFFVSSYGNYISFSPAASGGGLLLWLAPLLLLAVALGFAARLFIRRRS